MPVPCTITVSSTVARTVVAAFAILGLSTTTTACWDDTTPAPDGAEDVADTQLPEVSDTTSDTSIAMPDTLSDIETPDTTDSSEPPDIVDVAEVAEDTVETDSDTTPQLPIEPAIVTVVDTTAWLWVGIVSPTTFIATDGDTWHWLAGAEPTPIVVPDDSALALPAADTAPSLVRVATDEVLLGGGHGLSRIRSGALVGGPLVERFAGDPISALTLESNSPLTFWISGADGLKRWSDGNLRPYTATGVSFADNQLAWGAPFAPENDPLVAPPTPPLPSLWLTGPHGTSALRVSANPPTLGLERPDLATPAVTAVGTDREGNLYAATWDTLHVRLPASGRGLWSEVWLPSPPRLIAAQRQSSAIWVLLQDGRLLRGSGAAFAEVAPVPSTLAGATSMALHDDGRLLVATFDGLYEISASRTVTIGNLPSTTPLARTTEAVIRASDPESVVSANAALRSNGTIVARPPVVISGTGAARTLAVSVDPHLVPNGNAELSVTVTWQDDDSVTAAAPFLVDFPTWSNDVAAIYTGYCGSCHGPDNGGNFASLHVPAAWASRIDNILCRIDAHAPAGTKAPECATLGFDVASMPPGRTVSSDRVDLVRQWRDAGFRD